MIVLHEKVGSEAKEKGFDCRGWNLKTHLECLVFLKRSGFVPSFLPAQWSWRSTGRYEIAFLSQLFLVTLMLLAAFHSSGSATKREVPILVIADSSLIDTKWDFLTCKQIKKAKAKSSMC